MIRSAELSPCGRYRYKLSREWHPTATQPGVVAKRVCFVMCNPSTADASVDDPTIRKCIGFAQRWGFEALDVVNLLAIRATDLCYVPTNVDWVGPENEATMLSVAKSATRVVVAWGAVGAMFAPHARTASALLRSVRVDAGDGLKCLGVTKAGHPRHPLMVAYATKLELYP